MAPTLGLQGREETEERRGYEATLAPENSGWQSCVHPPFIGGSHLGRRMQNVPSVATKLMAGVVVGSWQKGGLCSALASIHF